MKNEILEQKDNPLLKRKEITVKIDFGAGATPSKEDLRLALAQQLGADAEHIEITKILSETGVGLGKAWIKVWEEKKIPSYKKAPKAEEEKK